MQVKGDRSKVKGNLAPFTFNLSPLTFHLTGGLTLVELMVASSILAIGLVMVGRGLLAASATLDSVEDRLEAIRFLDAKLAQLRQEAESQGGVEAETRSGAIALRHRQAAWTLDIVPLEPETAGPETQEPPIRLASAHFRLSWQEGRRTQDAVLATYLDYKPSDADEGLEAGERSDAGER